LEVVTDTTVVSLVSVKYGHDGHALNNIRPGVTDAIIVSVLFRN